MNLEILHFVFEGPSFLESERDGHEGPSTVFECLSPLESEGSEHEGSSLFEGLSDLESKRYDHYRPSSFLRACLLLKVICSNSIRFVFHSKYDAMHLKISHLLFSINVEAFLLLVYMVCCSSLNHKIFN